MSRGFIPFNPFCVSSKLLASVEAFAASSPAEEIITPSITYKGSLFPLKLLAPLIFTETPEPGLPAF